MRKMLIVVLLFYSCSFKQDYKSIDCSDSRLAKLVISAQYNASINLPSEWVIIDSSIYGVNKNLISAKKIYSKDSSNSAFILVQDFKQGIRLNNDTSEIKKYLKTEVREMKNGLDSIFSINSYSVNGWNTVTQKTFLKNSNFIFIGQILSVNNSKEVRIVLQVSSQNFENGNNTLDCIISSYSLSQQ